MRLSSQTTSTGPEVAPAREVDAEDPLAGQRQHLALADQVVGEERQQRELGELAGLDREAADQDPQLGPVDHRVLGRQQRRDHAPARCRPGRGCTRTATATRWSRMMTSSSTAPSAAAAVHWIWRNAMPVKTRQVGPLLGRHRAEVEPAQERHPEPVDQRHRRQQDRIGVRGEEPDRDVHAEEDHEQDRRTSTQTSGVISLDQAGLDRGRVDAAPPPWRRSAAPARRRAGYARRPTRATAGLGAGAATAGAVTTGSSRGLVAVGRRSRRFGSRLSGRPGGSPVGRSAPARSDGGRRRPGVGQRARRSGRRPDRRRGRRGRRPGSAVGQNGSTFVLLGSSSVVQLLARPRPGLRAGCPPSPSPGRPGSARRRCVSLTIVHGGQVEAGDLARDALEDGDRAVVGDAHVVLATGCTASRTTARRRADRPARPGSARCAPGAAGARRPASSAGVGSGAASRGWVSAEARAAGVEASAELVMPRSLAAAPPTTGDSSTMSASVMSATITVMLSGPPPRSASWISRSAHWFGSEYSRMVAAIVSSETTPDRPSLQIRYRSPAHRLAHRVLGVGVPAVQRAHEQRLLRVGVRLLRR